MILTTTLPLPGWDQRSMWGHDPAAGRYNAQLTSNTRADTAERPDIWVTSPYDPPVTDLDDLAAAIAVAAGAAVDDVLRALVSSARGM